MKRTRSATKILFDKCANNNRFLKKPFADQIHMRSAVVTPWSRYNQNKLGISSTLSARYTIPYQKLTMYKRRTFMAKLYQVSAKKSFNVHFAAASDSPIVPTLSSPAGS